MGFLMILLAIAGLQTMIMFSGKITTVLAHAFSVHLLGLTETQWVICLLVGLATFPLNFGLKFFPEHYCPVLGEENESDVEAAKNDYNELLAIARKYKFRDSSNSQRFIQNKPGDSFKGH